jgi:hypothetical protein
LQQKNPPAAIAEACRGGRRKHDSHEWCDRLSAAPACMRSQIIAGIIEKLLTSLRHTYNFTREPRLPAAVRSSVQMRPPACDLKKIASTIEKLLTGLWRTYNTSREST